MVLINQNIITESLTKKYFTDCYANKGYNRPDLFAEIESLGVLIHKSLLRGNLKWKKEEERTPVI